MHVFTYKTRVSSFLSLISLCHSICFPGKCWDHSMAWPEQSTHQLALDTPAWNSLPKYRPVMDLRGWLMSWDKLLLLMFPLLFRKGAWLPNPRWHRHAKGWLLGTQHHLLLRKTWRMVSKWFSQPVRTEYISLWLRRWVMSQSWEYVLVAYYRMGYYTVNLGTNE